MAASSNSDTIRFSREGPAVETRREALGRFLRERRESLSPEEVGVSSHRGRRTPGLRREEVAFLADIGVKWYARLEAGDQIHPSAATLTSIALALRLSNAELEYIFDLAGLQQRSINRPDTQTIPSPLAAFTRRSSGVAVALSDRILTPILWNRVANAIHRFSDYENPVERNSLVRALFDPYSIALLAAEREKLVFRAVGMFRLNETSSSPSPFAADVYAMIKEHPLFISAWKQRTVSSELTSFETTVREHPVVGKLNMYAADFNTTMRDDLFLRATIPADDETAAKFARLERLSDEDDTSKEDVLTVCS